MQVTLQTHVQSMQTDDFNMATIGPHLPRHAPHMDSAAQDDGKFSDVRLSLHNWDYLPGNMVLAFPLNDDALSATFASRQGKQRGIKLYDGVNHPATIVSTAFSSPNAHREDCNLGAINHMIFGSLKVWHTVPGKQP